MTVVTPGGPCLTQTQITRNENQERFQQQQESKSAAQPNSIQITAETPTKIAGVQNLENNPQNRQPYGAPGEYLVDITV